MGLEKGQSFIFRDESVNIFIDGFDDSSYRSIIEQMRFFARANLLVIQMTHQGLINSNQLIPMTMRIVKDGKVRSGAFPIRFGINKLEETDLQIFKDLVNQLSSLMSTIIPGMELIAKEYGKETLKSGKIAHTIELLSRRGDIEIPIINESDGIIRIISILSALISMYNNSSVCVAIDELDAGIFEYLLGEILKVINDSGKGQLIFTSHNLRALEVLKKESVFFTTTNDQDRYIKFSNIKSNNNLRNVYLRTIEIGGQKECVYEDTDLYEISRAFRKAGKVDEHDN